MQRANVRRKRTSVRAEYSSAAVGALGLRGLALLRPAYVAARNFPLFRRASGHLDIRSVNGTVVRLTSLTRWRFSENLRRFTNQTRAQTRGLDAHHVFPYKIRAEFQRRGINVNDPRFGTWWDRSIHRSKSYEFQQQWDEFFYQTPNATAEDVFSFGRQLCYQYGLTCHF
jgi:hypothetical protein